MTLIVTCMAAPAKVSRVLHYQMPDWTPLTRARKRKAGSRSSPPEKTSSWQTARRLALADGSQQRLFSFSALAVSDARCRRTVMPHGVSGSEISSGRVRNERYPNSTRTICISLQSTKLPVKQSRPQQAGKMVLFHGWSKPALWDYRGGCIQNSLTASLFWPLLLFWLLASCCVPFQW